MPPKRPRIVPVAPAPAPAPATVAVPARAKRTPRRAATPPPVVAPKAKRTRRAADPPAPVPVPADPIVPALAPAPALVAAAPPAANVPTPALTALDLAISFDTTGSMGPCLYQVRKELAALTQELFTNMAAMGVQVRVAVIAQADYDASPFVTKHMDFSDRAIDVATFITGVTASSGCWNEGEAYEQALRLGNNLTWRPDATKAFVIVGDDLPHAPDFHGNDLHVDWRQEARELATKDVALYSVQCPCLDIPRAKHFYEALAAVHPKGAYVLLTQFNAIIDMLLALVFYARGDAPAIEDHERQLMARGRYNRGIEVAFNALLQREDAQHAALGPQAQVQGQVQGQVQQAKRVPVPPGRFQRLEVDAPCSIRDFVTATGAVFEAGRGFYELTKPENVSAKKEVVLEHLTSGEMFSGTDAKELLGLPPAGNGHVTKRSIPAGYRTFIQSTSYNRKLMAGTTFLYEMA